MADSGAPAGSPTGKRRRKEVTDHRGPRALEDEAVVGPVVTVAAAPWGGTLGAGSRPGPSPEEKTRVVLEVMGWKGPRSILLLRAVAWFEVWVNIELRLQCCQAGGRHSNGLLLHSCETGVRCVEACRCKALTGRMGRGWGIPVEGSHGVRRYPFPSLLSHQGASVPP